LILLFFYQSTSDCGVEETLTIPSDDRARWKIIHCSLQEEGAIDGASDFAKRMSTYNTDHSIPLHGLTGALTGKGGGEDITKDFYDRMLPSIIQSAIR